MSKKRRKNERIRRKETEKNKEREREREKHIGSVHYRMLLTKDDLCDTDILFAYNSTIIFFKNAVEHKTRGNVK